jgi:hypothetical protein
MDKTIVLMNMKIKNEKKTMHLKVYRTVTGTNHTTAAAPLRPLKNKLSTHGTFNTRNKKKRID